MNLRVGIDIGSTTVKVVVLDEANELLFRSYERHYSKTRERACETLHSIEDLLKGQDVKLVITGSAGLGVAKAAGLDFVQEVYATAAAVNTYIPDTDAVIELGGEDAKIIFFGGALEERMNGSCAGGTGAFIDQMATLMNVTVNELDALSLNHEKIYPIASRCGVFAKSDIQPILNQGGRKEDVAASIFQAVVDQTVAGLTQGRELKGRIVFLGGPLHFLTGLRRRFVETLQLDEEHAVFPADGDCFAAMGAALCSEDYEAQPFEVLLKRLEESRGTATTVDVMPPLFDTQEEYDAFLARHNASTPPAVDVGTYTGDAYLGIDAGSTTTKMALIVVLNLIRSRAGRAILAIRDNRIAAESVGINVTTYKMMAFVTSAALAGAAGALYGANYSNLAASKFDFNTSILVLVFVVLGGLGRIWGSIIAAAVLYILPEALREFADYRMLVYAIVLILVMLLTNSKQVRNLLGRVIPKRKEAGTDG